MLAIRAIAGHTFTDAMRKKVWVMIILFALLMIGPVFIFPAALPKLHVRQVLSFALGNRIGSMRSLCCFAIILLAAWQLWKDITDRTIYTVITKPVSRVELVAGRLFGYMAVLLVLVIGMGVIAAASIVYVASSVEHDPTSLDPPILEVDAPIEASLGKRLPESDVSDDESLLARRKYHILTGSGPQRIEFRFLELDPRSFTSNNIRLKFRFVVNDPTKQDRPATEASIEVINENRPDSVVKETLVADNGIDCYVPLGREFLRDAESLTVIIRRRDPKYTVAIIKKRCQLLAHAEPFAVSFGKSMVLTFAASVLMAVVALTSSTILEGPVCLLWSFFVYFVCNAMHLIRETAETLSPGRMLFTGWLQHKVDFSTPFGKTVYGINNIIRYFLNGLTKVVPDLSEFDAAQFLTRGMHVSREFWQNALFYSVIYICACLIIAFVAFKNREVGYK